MNLTVTTWNINSVRLRIDLVAKFLRAARPDVICFQETKCPDDKFPLKRFARLGYVHAALNGQKGYHGVAILSRLPFDSIDARSYCGKSDSRHIAVKIGDRAGFAEQLTLHNFYVPAGGDEPDPTINEKFAHKLAFLDEMRGRSGPAARRQGARDPGRRSQRRAARARRVEPQAAPEGRLPYPDRMREAQRRAKSRRVVRRVARLRARTGKLYTWWSYRAQDWEAADRGRRLDHIWVSPAMADRVSEMTITKQARGWVQPSDHVPVTAAIEV